MSRMRPARNKPQRRGSRQAQQIRWAIANELRQAREDAGLSLRALASAAGVSHSTLRDLELGRHDPTTEVLTRVSTVLGLALSVKFFTGTGPLVRDHVQATMLGALLQILHPRWRFRPEVAAYRPVRGVVDLVLDDPTNEIMIACEAQSELRRIEQQVRWQGIKADALRWRDDGDPSPGRGPSQQASPRRIGRLMLLRSSAQNRTVVAGHAALIAAAYPSPARLVYEALAREGAWPGDGLLWCRVERGEGLVLDRPPRGVPLAR